MKRYKRLLILTAVLALVCLATFALTRHQNKQDQLLEEAGVVAQISPESVLSFSWDTYDSGSYAFQKTDSGWKYLADDAFQVSTAAMQTVLQGFTRLTASFMIPDVADFSQYGLTNPKITLHLETAERTYTFKMGSFSQMDEHRYMDMGDGNVYLVSNDPASRLSNDLSFLLKHDTIPAFSSVVNITFRGAENYTVNCGANNTYTTVRNGETVQLDAGKIQQYLSAISAVYLQNDADYNATEDELKTYGLDDPDLIITVNYAYQNDAGETVSDACVLRICEDPEERAAADKVIAEGGVDNTVTKYIRVGDSPIVYQLQKTSYDALMACSYEDLSNQKGS